MTKKATSLCPRSETGAHYWIIEPADGPTSTGECKYCHQKSQFINAVPKDINPFFGPMAIQEARQKRKKSKLVRNYVPEEYEK